MTDYWLIRAGKGGELWEDWSERDIITIGWDIGDLREEEWDRKETKDRIISEHSAKDAGKTTGMVRSFVGVRSSDVDNLKPGDKAIVLGNASVVGLGEVGNYRYEGEGLPDNPSHTYWRDLDYDFKGPIRISDLSRKFHQGGDFSLHLVPTLKSYNPDTDEDYESVLDELLDELKEAEPIPEEQTYIDFNEAALQSYIDNHIQEIDSEITEVTREYKTPAGRADFYCQSGNGRIIIIETKIGTAKHSAVSQLQSYMNSVRNELEKPVSGILIAESFGNKTRFAAQSDDIELLRFQTKLEFSPL